MSNLTLSQYLEQKIEVSSPHLASVIQTIVNCCEKIDHDLQSGALADILGSSEQENVQGETQKKLDILSNQILIDALEANPAVGGLASEELEEFTPAQKGGQYLVLFDPLDGSSNIDINMCVGTIFSVLPAKNEVTQAEDFLQTGDQQVAAGYVMYGPATMLALTFGSGVVIFTYDTEKSAFILTHENAKIAKETQEFAVNSSNQRHWEKPVKRYIDELFEGAEGPRAKDFNMRWVACMVADVHRILMRGGVFLYPFDHKYPNQAGRLRLMYEANPMSMLIEQAGGASSTGRERILSMQPQDLHQRVPVIFGAEQEVNILTQYH